MIIIHSILLIHFLLLVFFISLLFQSKQQSASNYYDTWLLLKSQGLMRGEK